MTRVQTALLWASVIIAAAIIMSAINLSDAASFAVVTGLTGAAWAALGSDYECSKGCLK